MSRDLNGGFFAPVGMGTKRWVAPRFNVDRYTEYPFFNSEGYQMFSRPEVKSNPKNADGYRAPSDYYMRPYALIGDSRHERSLLGIGTMLSNPYVIADHSDPTNVNTYDATGEILVRYPLPYVFGTNGEYNLKQELRTKILGNIKDEMLDVSMVLAELRGTSRTAANMMLRVGRSMDAVRRRTPESFAYLMHGKLGVDKRRFTQRFLKETAGVFLEWKYGIMPSLIDYTNAINALDLSKEGAIFDNPPLCVARASVRRSYSNAIQPFWNVGNKAPREKVVCKTEVTASARCDYRIDGEGLRGLSQFGLGPGTMATVLWDKTPFSFVLDMMLPVADLIKAWTALAGVETIGYSETIYQTHSIPASSLSLDTDNAWKYRALTKPTKTKEFVRFASSRPPMPTPFIKNPIKVNNLSTVLALFTQLRDNPKRPEKIHGFDNKDL